MSACFSGDRQQNTAWHFLLFLRLWLLFILYSIFSVATVICIVCILLKIKTWTELIWTCQDEEQYKQKLPMFTTMANILYKTSRPADFPQFAGLPGPDKRICSDQGREWSVSRHKAQEPRLWHNILFRIRSWDYRLKKPFKLVIHNVISVKYIIEIVYHQHPFTRGEMN